MCSRLRPRDTALAAEIATATASGFTCSGLRLPRLADDPARGERGERGDLPVVCSLTEAGERLVEVGSTSGATISRCLLGFSSERSSEASGATWRPISAAAGVGRLLPSTASVGRAGVEHFKVGEVDER